MRTKTLSASLWLTALAIAGCVSAADVFPGFSSGPITVKIDTNTLGYVPDPAFEVGSNVVYTLTGHIFTNASAGHLQTLAEGFSGTTDKSTPWKTLTELLAVYQQGTSSNSIRQLYTAESQPFMDEIFTNADGTSRLRNFGLSVTNMQVLLGFNWSNGFFAVTAFGSQENPYDTMPYYFVQTNGQYLLSEFEMGEPKLANIGVFLNTHSVTNLLP
jgi:hypothetical protein